MAAKEALNLPCPFAGQERAHGIDQATTRADKLRCIVEQTLLRSSQPLKPLSRQTPSPFRIAPPRPASGAWRIDQDEVSLVAPVSKLVELMGRTEQACLDNGPC